jgi:hypothetical protein
MTRILVIGAGQLGLAILKGLSSHPSKPTLTVLLRPSTFPTRQELLGTLDSLQVSVHLADVTQADLPTQLGGYDIVISATGFAGGPGTQRHICQSALQAHVPWFIPWQFGVDYDKIGRGSSQPLFDEQLDVRDMLRGQSTTRWTIISTGIFTSFLFDPAFGVIHRKGHGQVVVNALGKWENRVTMTSAEDIGRLTAAIVCDDTSGQSEVIYVAGETASFDGLADKLQASGWEVERKLTTVDELVQARREHPEDLGPKYQLIWARNVGVSWDFADTWNARNGIPVQGLDDWIDRNFRP